MIPARDAMNGDQRGSAKDIFNDALELAPHDRAEFLARACDGNPVLRQRVLNLLALHDSGADFLAAATVDPHWPDMLPDSDEARLVQAALIDSDPAATSAPRAELDSPGAHVGPYKLLERIGEGGFGVVYMAEQEKPVRRRVALKVIKLGMDTRQVIARFEAERQALAMMDHPHIARVFDAGATQTGRPYFVMELVRGTPITTFCDEHRMTVRQRLDLFVQVCQAVQHAHTKGVIHRDLKPSNILAVRNDDTSSIKVIDFGIVKATGGRLTEQTIHTEWRQLIGTPAYMSPEQAGMSDLDVDTRSDIYALGVLLYELLTGTTPFDATSLLASGYDEMRRIIREVEPPTPSRRISGASGAGGDSPGNDRSSSAQAVASCRGIETSALRRLVQGDLDWIVMKCLEKDRGRRYETSHDVARDVQRYLRDEPVSAGPPSRLYRLRKLVRRNRGAFVAAGFVSAAVLAGLAVATYGFVQAGRQQQRAEATGGFLKEVLTLADPAKTRGEKLTVREALDRAAHRIEEGALAGQPLVEADIRFTIGSTYFTIGSFKQAEAQLRAADAFQSRELGDEHPDTLRTRCKLAETFWYNSDYRGVAVLAQPTMVAQRRVLGPDHPDTLQTMGILGRVLWAEPGRFAEAESMLRSVLERRERNLGPNHPDTADALDWLGEAYTFNSYADKAELLHRRALRIHTATLGEEHPATLYSLFLLAGSLSELSRNEEAEALQRRVLEARFRVLGPDHTDTLASQLCVAIELAKQGRHAEAEAILRETRAAHVRTVGPAHINTIHGQRFLAGCLEGQGKYAEAETLLRDALQTAVEKYGPEDSDTSIRIMCQLAQVLSNQSKDAEAEQVAREVLGYQRRQQPRPAEGDFTQSSLALVHVLQRRGANDEAIRIEQELLDYFLAAARAPDASAKALDGAAVRLLYAQNRELRDESRALQLALKANQKSGRQNPHFLGTLASAYVLTGDSAKAAEVWEEAIALLADDRVRAQTLNGAARELLTVTPENFRNPAAALQFALRANELTGYKNPDCLDTLALACHRTGETARAIELQQKAISLLAADSPDRAECEEQLREFQAAFEQLKEKTDR